MSLIFIDANKYLDFFRSVDVEKTFNRLLSLRGSTLVTQQVVNEVQRNKLTVFAGCSFKYQQDLSYPEMRMLPDSSVRKALRERIAKAKREVESIAKDIRQEVTDHFEKLSRSEDSVSRKLTEFWGTPTVETAEELKRARIRRELGNPPGKKTDSLGDQVSWEQLLSCARHHDAFWIATSDTDYIAESGKSYRLNPFLFAELVEASGKAIKVSCFGTIAEALDDFVRTTGKIEDQTPTAEDVSQLAEQEREALRFTQFRAAGAIGPQGVPTHASSTMSGLPYFGGAKISPKASYSELGALAGPQGPQVLECPHCGALAMTARIGDGSALRIWKCQACGTQIC